MTGTNFLKKTFFILIFIVIVNISSHSQAVTWVEKEVIEDGVGKGLVYTTYNSRPGEEPIIYPVFGLVGGAARGQTLMINIDDLYDLGGPNENKPIDFRYDNQIGVRVKGTLKLQNGETLNAKGYNEDVGLREEVYVTIDAFGLTVNENDELVPKNNNNNSGQTGGGSSGGSSGTSGTGSNSGSGSSSGGSSTELGNLDDYAQPSSSDPEEFRQKANKVIGVIQVCGSIFSVIALIAIGIRYMFSSIEEKAEYKKTMIGYMIGCIMVFCLTNILAFIYDLANP